MTNTPDTKLDTTQSKNEDRFTILPDGLIAYQPQKDNPLPGPSVARLRAGAHWLIPDYDFIGESLAALKIEEDEMKSKLKAWMKEHIPSLLPFAKENPETPENLKSLLAKIADEGGIAERAELDLPELTSEERFFLRSQGLRLGPVHIYYHQMLKPAPLTLRALLWATHEGLKHPLPYPRAGVTSYSWPENVTPDTRVQHWFGYPLYGRRACRVDRIDKIICDVYDSAQKGVFSVKNTWAEWLGCGVEDVCTILDTLGHTRTTPPIDPNAVLDEGAEKPTIDYRLRVDKKPFKNNAENARTRAPKKFDKSSDKKPFDKSSFKGKSKKRNDQSRPPKKKFGEETPLTNNPFADLKEMIK